MRPATIRRLLVLGVCLAGIGCLYVVPSMAGAPRRVGTDPASTDVTATSSTGTTVVTALSAESTAARPAASARSDAAGPTTSPTSTAGTGRSPGGRDDSRKVNAARVGATAVDPGQDAGRPSAVGPVTVVSADPERLIISWPAVDDDVVGYEVWLNGFFVVTVQQARARLAWFNDSDSHVIQVRALDAAGHEGPASPTLLVRRPAPTTEPTPSAASPSSTPPTTAPPAPPPDENAETGTEPIIATSSPTTAEAGDDKEAHP